RAKAAHPRRAGARRAAARNSRTQIKEWSAFRYELSVIRFPPTARTGTAPRAFSNILAETTPCIYAVREVSTGQRSIHTQFGLRMATSAPILSLWRWRIVRTAAALAGRSSSATRHGRKCARGLGPKPMLRACQMWTFSIWRRARPYTQRNHKALVRGYAQSRC